jgi:glycine dehydrogenase subunit 2
MSRRVQLFGEDENLSVTERLDTQTIFELSQPGRTGFSLPTEPADTDAAMAEAIPSQFARRTPPALPEVSELTVMRHFTHLSGRTMGVETTFYPLGSCTMKYNPKINEYGAWLPGFTNLHPDQPESTMQGLLEAYYQVQEILGTLTDLPAVSLQPAAGAHGEFTALLMAKAYFADRGETERTEVIIPDTAHGTNPASAYRVGLEPVEIKSNERGRIDVEAIRKVVGPKTACLMVTNPNTCGLFEENLAEAAELVHQAGGLVYIDGANFNAIVGRVRPADFGGDMMHINLHKTFSIPHGGGGPGAGPIVVREFLRPYLPRPTVVRHGEQGNFTYSFNNDPKSIGKVRSYFGNVAHVVRAYAYLRQLGEEGLRAVSDYAVLNANFLLALLAGKYDIPYGNRCMHEFVIDATRQKKQGVKAVDIAKKLIDYGFHPPTTYFPLIVPEALMIEPTETENMEMLELFAATMIDIANKAAENSDDVVNAPLSTPVRRLDELGAARNPVVTA